MRNLTEHQKLFMECAADQPVGWPEIRGFLPGGIAVEPELLERPMSSGSGNVLRRLAEVHK